MGNHLQAAEDLLLLGQGGVQHKKVSKVTSISEVERVMNFQFNSGHDTHSE